jgi:cytidylate kinase
VDHEIIIAIDGFSACGKSTLARDLATALHYLHIDSGAMYRAVTLYFIRQGISTDDASQVAAALTQIEITFRRMRDGMTILLNGEHVQEAIRANDVNRLVSPVATISAVRRFLVDQQRKIGSAANGLVMDGRDIGTVVFPDAELKIFLTASREIRIERRFTELTERGVNITRAQVAESLAYRDHIDSTREDSPLTQAADAIVIDNTLLTRGEQRTLVLQLALEAINRKT